jgi:hypothetical protein
VRCRRRRAAACCSGPLRSDSILTACSPRPVLLPARARKLLLAFGLDQGVWALVLDEPTNHLEQPSIERLHEALAAYDDALVSHDDHLAKSCTKTVRRNERERVRTV